MLKANKILPPSLSLAPSCFTLFSPCTWPSLTQVIEALAKEDTDIKSEHITQIKELIKKELTLEEVAGHKKAAAQTQLQIP